MSESDFATLQELVSPDIYGQLEHSISDMSLGSRENLAIQKEDIYAAFPYQVSYFISLQVVSLYNLCFINISGRYNVRR